ncbi:hypothetical protein [Streptomyces sp. NPDC046371]|uniref:hypothetical protein n=1 Tax=Streptomyces sp. NPDC046371 TaxID=3154916 RepID=UPI0033E0BACE
MLTTTIGVAALTAGYVLGRARLGHRASDWANWQRYGARPTGLRYAAVWTVLSAENIAWLLTHPIKGWRAWQHRNDPPPPRSPAPQLRRITPEPKEPTA